MEKNRNEGPYKHMYANKHEKVFKLKARERSININCKEIKCNKQKLILENDRQIKMFTKK